MLNKDEIAEAVSLDFLRKGYAILNKPKGRRKGADIIARDPGSKTKLFVSAAGRPAAHETAGKKTSDVHTESQVLDCMKRSVCSALRMRKEDQFLPGDRIALAFPDAPECRRYLDAEKPVLDSLGVKVILVNEEKQVEVI